MENTEVYVQENSQDRSSSKFLAKVFGYMFVGVAITALASFAWAIIVAKFFTAENGELTETGSAIVIGTAIACFIGCLVLPIVNGIVTIKTKRAPWVGYILYALCIGGFLSIIILAGIDLYTLAEAFGATALAFGAMFLVGYFSKKNLNWLALVGMGLGISVLSLSLFWGLIYLFSPNTFEILYVITSLIIVVICMIFTAVDCYNIKNIAEKGEKSNDIALYCAFVMYSDFINLFLRILYVLLASKKN